MKKRMISVALVLAMALSMTMTVSAADWESEIDTLGVAVVGNKYYQTVQEAVNNANGEYVKLIADPKGEEVTNSAEPLYMDLNGFDVEINGGSVYLIDSATDDGEVGGTLSGTITKYQDVTEKGVIDYLVLEKDGVKTANAVRVQLIRVTIRPSQTETKNTAGIFYTTNFAFNQNVVDAGATYGVVLSAVDAPVAAFENDDSNGDGNCDNLWTAGTPTAGKDFSTNSNSCLLSGILSSDLEPEQNTTRGEAMVYADAYVKVGDTVILSENRTKPIEYSIETIMLAFNEKIGTMVDPTKTNILNFYGTWTDVMSGWSLDNIADALTESAE